MACGSGRLNPADITECLACAVHWWKFLRSSVTKTQWTVFALAEHGLGVSQGSRVKLECHGRDAQTGEAALPRSP